MRKCLGWSSTSPSFSSLCAFFSPSFPLRPLISVLFFSLFPLFFSLPFLLSFVVFLSFSNLFSLFSSSPSSSSSLCSLLLPPSSFSSSFSLYRIVSRDKDSIYKTIRINLPNAKYVLILPLNPRLILASHLSLSINSV